MAGTSRADLERHINAAELEHDGGCGYHGAAFGNP
jgi:hypothetical protein